MRILLIDPMGLALDWVMRCQDDGHEVKWFIRDTEKSKLIGKGLATIVRDWRPWMRWADLVMVSDNTLYLREIDAWRNDPQRTGAKVIGATDRTAEWELDRTKGIDVLKKHGIACPPFKEFTDYDSAIAFVKKQDRPFVSKPSGDANKALSYVAKTPADLVYMLERWKKASKLKTPFILQEKIEGCEMAVGGWFGPGGFNEGWCENWEFKKLFVGDMGPNTGEQGTVMRYVRSSKLAKKVLAPLAPLLEREGYTGYIDVNCIVDDKGQPWPLEFTMRFGWPTFNIQQALHSGDRAEWLLDLADGKDAKNAILNQVAVGVVLAIPDYPYSHLTRKEVVGVPLYGSTPSVAKNVHPCEMMAGEAPHQVNEKVVTMPCLVTAGDYVLVASGIGSTVRMARDQAYRILKRLSLPNSPFYRTDIGNRLKRQLPECQKHGYALNLDF